MNEMIINELKEQKLNIEAAIKNFDEYINGIDEINKVCNNTKLIELDNRLRIAIEKSKSIAMVQLYTIEQLENVTDDEIENKLFEQLNVAGLTAINVKHELVEIMGELMILVNG